MELQRLANNHWFDEMQLNYSHNKTIANQMIGVDSNMKKVDLIKNLINTKVFMRPYISFYDLPK